MTARAPRTSLAPRWKLFACAVAGALAGPATAEATPGTVFALNGPTPCYVNSCTMELAYDAAQMAGPGTVEVDWDHEDGLGFVPRAGRQCGPTVPPGALSPCLFYSPTYSAAGTHTVMIRVTDADSSAALGSSQLVVAPLPPPPVYTPPSTLPTFPPPSASPPVQQGASQPPPTPTRRRPTPPPNKDPSSRAPSRGDGEGSYELCRNTPPNVRCQPGGGRQSAGGGAKVSHKGWPRITGVFWQVMDSSGRKKAGGAKNDELLGHHGSDSLSGGAGKDVLWGDWDPANNNGRQRDVLRGGAGNDFIYPSHGTTTVVAGPGKDYIWAFYGRGVIDCGPGYDTVRVRLNGPFKLRNCEVVGHFCAFGPDGRGGCLKPGEKRPAKGRSARSRAAGL